MEQFSSHSCVKWRPHLPTDMDYVHILRDSGCYSRVGRTGRAQVLSLGEENIFLFYSQNQPKTRTQQLLYNLTGSPRKFCIDQNLIWQHNLNLKVDIKVKYFWIWIRGCFRLRFKFRFRFSFFFQVRFRFSFLFMVKFRWRIMSYSRVLFCSYE